MKTLFQAARLALMALCALLASAPMLSAPARAGALQCAPFARAVSGIALYGNAYRWWDQAAGRYARGQAPRVGAVLAFAATRGMRNGHVAMVSRVIGPREVLLTHANWSRRGGIERDVRAVDVSPNGDWSQVRVWFGPIGDLGLRAYPAHGFIYADRAPAEAPERAPLIARATAGAPGIATFAATLD